MRVWYTGQHENLFLNASPTIGQVAFAPDLDFLARHVHGQACGFACMNDLARVDRRIPLLMTMRISENIFVSNLTPIPSSEQWRSFYLLSPFLLQRGCRWLPSLRTLILSKCRSIRRHGVQFIENRLSPTVNPIALDPEKPKPPCSKIYRRRPQRVET